LKSDSFLFRTSQVKTVNDLRIFNTTASRSFAWFWLLYARHQLPQI